MKVSLMFRLPLVLCAAAVVAGCSISPEDNETTPVVLQTAAGPVTCQLYRLDMVSWDRATDRPANMSVATADNLCRQEGVRIQKGGAVVEEEVIVVDAGL